MDGTPHDVGIEATRLRGECEECFAIAPALYQVWCDHGCFEGDFLYCSTCARRIDRNHANRYGMSSFLQVLR